MRLPTCDPTRHHLVSSCLLYGIFRRRSSAQKKEELMKLREAMKEVFEIGLEYSASGGHFE
jgi:hypothetical protein